jgi:hypothetical protein
MTTILDALNFWVFRFPEPSRATGSEHACILLFWNLDNLSIWGEVTEYWRMKNMII